MIFRNFKVILIKISAVILLMLLMISACNKNTIIPKPAERYKDELFAAITKTTLQYDVQPDYQGNATTLLADVYQPAEDNASARAAIIYVHGGGFTGGTRDAPNEIYFCESLAKKGYMVASIDYRLGYTNASSTVELGKAQLRAVQDLKSFIRFAKQNATADKIDTSKIFICGSSAGGATVLASAFLEYSERPSYTDTSGVGSLDGIGNLNGHSAKTKAVYSMWGAVTDTLWIKAGDIPVGAIQSINDPCIPWNSVASSCQMPGYATFGSNAIYRRATNLGIYSTVYGFNSNQHDLGLNFPNIDTTIINMSAFLYPLAK